MRTALFFAAVSCSLVFSGCDSKPKGDSKTGSSSAAPAADVKPAEPVAIPGAQIVPLSPTVGSVTFTGVNVTTEQKASFKDFKGKVQLVADAIDKSQVDLKIELGSVDAKPEKFKKHLLSPDFFDQKQFPTASFVSTKLVPGGSASNYQMTGTLTLRGRTKELTFPIAIKLENGRLVADADFSFNRQDFGVSFPGAADNLIKDEVQIKLHFDAPLEGAAAPAAN